MTLTTATGTVIIVNVFLLIAWDLYVKVREPDGSATISWVLLTAAKHFPIIAAAGGMLLAHLFWQNCNVP